VPDLQEQLQAAVGDTYRIEKELGGGGMSRVFLAEEVALGRRVVNPPYLYLAPDIPIENVRERYYMGVCRMTDHLTPVFAYFVEKKEEIYDLYRNEPALSPKQLEQTPDNFDEFSEIITNEELATEHIRAA
jgi:hypothetical protein